MDHIPSQLFLETFFTKMAAHGYVPETPEQAEWLLQTAGILKQAYDELAVTQSAQPDGTLGQITNDLSNALDQLGVTGHRKQAAVEEELARQAVVEQLAADPVIRQGFLMDKIAEASLLEDALAEYLAGTV